jgi:transposase-like protein
MAKRQCLACGGELVMAFRPSEITRSSSGEAGPAKSNSKWRCSTCGQSFTAEELRADKRAHLKAAASG